MAQSGSIHDELVILPETPGKPYPPLPMEVDDLYIYPNHIEAQPHGVVPELVGFNANVKVYQSYTTLATTELTYGINEVFDWERQSKVLDQSLRNSKRVLDELPSELSVWLEGAQENQAPNLFAPGQEMQGREPLMLLALNGSEQSPEEKRKTQYEIQKANIYLSQLATRSYITERYFNMRDINNHTKAQNQEQSSPAVGAAGLDSMLQESSPNYDALDHEMTTEKDKIVKDLLRVLQSISQIHMEPNADSFTWFLFSSQTHKVRQIVSTLLNEPQDRKSSVALQAEQYLHHFLEILVRLDRARPTNPQNQDAPEDEEAELKNWADLREYQLKIAQAGGALSLQGNP
ncbi:putative transcription factor [Diplodia seriata]|uniref:Putative transcription factor n=1 Tax=Diplodia seriata TaxID=420778 RepID=A0A0G2HCV5_9PEZI|nr:putative transcription factor [Diplodia seriata]